MMLNPDQNMQFMSLKILQPMAGSITGISQGLNSLNAFTAPIFSIHA